MKKQMDKNIVIKVTDLSKSFNNNVILKNINFELQKKLHLFGRYGITMFAISGVDIALWDIVAKNSNLPLCNALGSAGIKKIPAYASLWRYENKEAV